MRMGRSASLGLAVSMLGRACVYGSRFTLGGLHLVEEKDEETVLMKHPLRRIAWLVRFRR
jgi:hypothetical protein